LAAGLQLYGGPLWQTSMIFLDFYNEYAAPEMLSALRILTNWKDLNGESFDTTWKAKLVTGDEQANEVDRARRHVKFYFLSAIRLHELGYISEEPALMILSGTNFWDRAPQ